jgi:Leucine-rich repeat (LRR) protein
MSGLRGRAISTENESDENDFLAPITAQRKLVIPPPFSRLPNLVSLSLAHNELRSPRTALAGLSSLPLLRRLDLSYNYLTHMQGANTMLGNLKELILTGNRIRTVRGLSRLYSLERLALDQNDLKDLASVAGLAKLPELRSLKLSGNPLTEYSEFLFVFPYWQALLPSPPFVCFYRTEEIQSRRSQPVSREEICRTVPSCHVSTALGVFTNPRWEACI